MAAMKIPLASTEPNLPVPAATLAGIDVRYGAGARPWIVLGIGASDPHRDWSDARWDEFLASVRQRTPGTVFLIGGGRNAARADKMIAHSAGAAAVNACDLKLIEALALLHRADLFIGTDSGPMNLALAAATPAFAMFGVNPVLSYSKFIHPIEPDGGPAPDGMLRISPTMVLAQVAPYLAARKQPA